MPDTRKIIDSNNEVLNDQVKIFNDALRDQQYRKLSPDSVVSFERDPETSEWLMKATKTWPIDHPEDSDYIF